jgi:hypothetical protein
MFQIGLFEFSLTDANLASIRDVAAHMGWLPEAIKKPFIVLSTAQYAMANRISTQSIFNKLVRR